MAATEPWAQLVGLCAHYGATPQRIREEAPFLLELPATIDAHRAATGLSEGDLSQAAFMVLKCVTKPDGAAEFNFKTSLYVRTCLGIVDSMNVYWQRMSDLVENSGLEFRKSRRDIASDRDAYMTSLAVTLLELDYYPCSDRSKKIEEDALQAAISIRRLFADYAYRSPEERNLFLRLQFEESRKLYECLDKYAPELSVSAREILVLTSLINGPYARRYAVTADRRRGALLHPAELLQYFGFEGEMSDAVSPAAAAASLESLTELVRSIGFGGPWYKILFLDAGRRSAERLNGSSLAKIKAAKIDELRSDPTGWSPYGRHEGEGD